MNRFGIVTIVGVGLIGGSIGRALRSRGLADAVVGLGRDPDRLLRAIRLGAIDRSESDPAHAAAVSDVVVLCTPVGRIAEDARAAAAAGPATMLITDAGSTKRRIVEAVEADPIAAARFVGAHPIAGSERNGVEHADGDLFRGRACVLTPTPRTPRDRLERARTFWASLGCQLVEMDPSAHDDALARTSHLPHAVAAALAASVPADALPLAAGAYRDTTRVAASDTDLWTAIFLQNRECLLDALADYEAHLGAFRRALADRDAEAIRVWWESSRRIRQGFEAGPSPLTSNA